MQDYTTYHFKTNMEMHGLGYCWRSLERCLEEDVREKIQRMRFTADKMVGDGAMIIIITRAVLRLVWPRVHRFLQ